ncbi:MAG: hypothetical protein GOU98_03980 [Candidatus Altiarchaeota archaeon]|nr:hypothetical protein [Candidatus Altiarchaeota archaeon]
MESIKIGFDLDRVIFDTNAYMKHIDEKLKEKNTSLNEFFSGNYGRKDLGTLTKELSKKIGEDETKHLLFDDLGEFVSKKLKGLAEFVRAAGGKVFVITVGDKYQKEKIKGFPYDKIITVDGDFSKIENAASLKLNLFIDDKAQVVKELRTRKINAHQVTWFLDTEHKTGAMKDALSDPDQLGPLVVNLLNDEQNSHK